MSVVTDGQQFYWQPIAPIWLQTANRNQADKMTYAPGQKQYIKGDLNRWQGWGSTPDEHGNIGPWLQLLEFLIPDADARKWFEQWLAYPLQHPGAKLYTAAVLFSRVQGLGKDILLEAVSRIYGTNATLIEASQLDEPFKPWLKDKQFIVGDEVQGRGTPEARRKAIERLKFLITSEIVNINEKYQPQFDLPNVINSAFTTNDRSAFELANEDRRFWIWEVPQYKPLTPPGVDPITGKPCTPADFYDGFAEWKNYEGIARLHDHLLHVDLEGFSPSAHAPMTQAKREMIEQSRSDVAQWAMELPESIPDLLKKDALSDSPGGTIIPVNLTNECILLTADELLALWQVASGDKKLNAISLGKELGKAGYHQAHNGKKVTLSQTRRERLWVIAPMEEA